MNWAVRRQVLIISGVVAVVLLLIAVTTIAIVYETPSCSDGKQNQDETGIDCGGTCSLLCTAEIAEPVVRFVRVISPQTDRYDVIAYIDNQEPFAGAKGVRVTVELYDDNGVKLGEKDALIDIPPRTTVPLYVANAYRGSIPATKAFLTFDTTSFKWLEPREEHVVPTVTNIETVNTETPRIRATLENPTAYPIYDIKPVATVFDNEGNAMASSQTYLAALPGQSTGTVLFTWTTPFASTPARIEVLPIVPL